MINVFVYGLDQFVVGDISKETTTNLAKLCETEPENINFIAVNNMVFHDGIEQTSWHCIIQFEAPHQLEILQSKIQHFLIEAFKIYCVNIEIQFRYYHLHQRHLFLNEDYPRYMDDKNSKNVEAEYEQLDEDEELFSGDIFANYDKHFHKD